jgi:hypothetical protein
MDARGSDDGSEFPKLQDCKKSEPSGRNLEITVKMNKWALLKETACNKMKSTTYPYHVVLIPKTKKQKRQRTWDKLPRWIKMSGSSRGHKIFTREGSVIDFDLPLKADVFAVSIEKYRFLMFI